MECEYCRTSSRKFLCSSCVSEKLQEFNAEIKPIVDEKNELIKQAEDYLQIKNTANLHLLLSERSRRERAVLTSTQQSRILERECGAVRQKVLQLRSQVERRRAALQSLKNNLKAQHAHRDLEHQKELAVAQKKWARMHKSMVTTRRVLVNELVSLFEIQYLEDKTLVICNVTIPNHLINVSKIDKTELNAAIGHVIHSTTLIARYLGVKLPFLLINNGRYSHARTTRWKDGKQTHSKMPLFLSDRNLRKFIVGMAMLSYDIAYLCYTQHVDVPLSQVTNVLQNLMQCCRAEHLGERSHTTLFRPVKDQSFSLDFNQVLRLTALRYRQEGTQILPTGLPDDRTEGQSSNDKHFYRVSSVEDHDGDDGRYRIGIAEGGRFQSSDDEDHTGFVDGRPDADNDENWNIVDLLPTYNDSDPDEDEEDLLKDTENGLMSFNLSASNLVPGVLGMMETLGSRGNDMSGIAYTFGLPTFGSRTSK
ncbi:hypothetical protein INT44_001811 [Umbelopsis vinacea]|uniref:Autophagy-related protein 14 n=1 Tax=Umbelopsis vinacea TaxID=44442 RepID=A0A8H7UG51_9FUNG|nr:hypothetical protein INT44_001811 [Umbelopsis vinacea]